MINREDLKAKTAEFLAAQSDTDKDDWYVTSREAAQIVMKNFEQFLFGEEDAKEERRRQYEELKKEFES